MNDTTSASEGEAGPVFRLIYRSRSLIAADQNRTELGEIFTTARRKNKRSGVTGALVISGDAFVQALEGEESVVRELYATISVDPRHTDVSTIEERTIDGRTFGRWAMAKVADGGGADIRLMSNANKGVIVAAPVRDKTITEDQEAVLASMREALTLDTLEK